MDGPLCPCCGNWRQAADERFCGLCGAGLVPMPVTQLASFTFADAPEKGLRDGRLAFRFEPTPEPAGPPLRVALVVDQTGERLGFTVPNDLEIDDTGNSDLLVDSDRMPASGPVSGRLVHEAEDGREVATLAQFGLRLPEPSFEVVPQTIELTEAGLRTGRVRVRLRCTDGLLAPLEAIRLSEPGRSEDPDIETALPGRAGGGTVLRVGEEVPVDLRIARRLADALRDSPAGLRRTLNVLLPGRSAQTLAATPLLRLDRPAQPVFDLPRRLDAMAGADLFLPVAIANKGAAPAALGKIALLGEGPADAAPVYAERDLAGWTLEGGGRAAFALDVPADGPAAELLATPGNRRVRLVQRFAGSAVAPLESELTLAVRGARTCNDILAIDFGTTESAAALLDAAGRSEPLELQLGDTGSFVPTVIAYRPGSDGRSVATVGAPARALARDPDARDLQYFDNIKWRLATPDTHELPGGEEVGWTRIAADYIAELKRRIEGHPAVAARIDAAYVTRPARFDAHAIGALKAAFRQAGIEPLLLAAHDAEPTTISESWPPVITGLARPNLDSLRRRALDTSESIFGTEPTGAVHHVLTVDVGGGSSDLSAFEVDYPDHANIAVQERGSAGSDSLAGNHMAEWIYTHLLRPTLVEALAAQGVTAADLPVHFSWQPLPAEGVSHIQDRNGLALASAVFDLQRNDGPIGELLGRLGSDDSYQGRDADDIYAFNRALAADDDESRKLWTRMTEVWRQMAYVPPALELATASGQAVQVAWPRTGLAIDFKQIMRTFRARFQQPMRAHLNRLVAAFDGASATDRPARVVVSGRGSLFPLFSRTVLAEIEWAFGDRAHTIHLISPAMAKAITSMGACYLARLVARDPNVRFVADIPHRLAIVAGPDPADPNRHRVTPFAGADLNGGSDGLMTAPARLPHGRSSRIIELVMVNDDEESVELDGTRVVARVHAVLEIPRGKTSYVVVRPVDAEHIDVGLALTDQPVPETPAEADFDTLHWLGQHHLPRA